MQMQYLPFTTASLLRGVEKIIIAIYTGWKYKKLKLKTLEPTLYIGRVIKVDGKKLICILQSSLHWSIFQVLWRLLCLEAPWRLYFVSRFNTFGLRYSFAYSNFSTPCRFHLSPTQYSCAYLFSSFSHNTFSVLSFYPDIEPPVSSLLVCQYSPPWRSLRCSPPGISQSCCFSSFCFLPWYTRFTLSLSLSPTLFMCLVTCTHSLRRFSPLYRFRQSRREPSLRTGQSFSDARGIVDF